MTENDPSARVDAEVQAIRAEYAAVRDPDTPVLIVEQVEAIARRVLADAR